MYSIYETNPRARVTQSSRESGHLHFNNPIRLWLFINLFTFIFIQHISHLCKQLHYRRLLCPRAYIEFRVLLRLNTQTTIMTTTTSIVSRISSSTSTRTRIRAIRATQHIYIKRRHKRMRNKLRYGNYIGRHSGAFNKF